MIPEKFLSRMKALLPAEEYAAFCRALTEAPVRGLRLNPRKATKETLLPLLPFEAPPVPFLTDCFFAPADPVGGLPAHHAGMFYMQDPSAGCVSEALPLRGGERVLDLCAAPGGKSIGVAGRLTAGGVLLSNEIDLGRCRVLQGNLERMGFPNTVVTHLFPAALADFYGAVFDLVLCDAPCSGEGMLRKYPQAGAEWKEENINLCRKRQREILSAAARLVAPGGHLLYSTCTFSPEENEETVDDFLTAHPDFSLRPVPEKIRTATGNGLVFPGAKHPESLPLCRRFYPHLAAGEGQFLALLARDPDETAKSLPKKDSYRAPGGREAALLEDFLSDALTKMPEGRRIFYRDKFYLAPDFPLPPDGLVTAGVCVGELQKGRILPHHQFFSAFGRLFRRQLPLTGDDPRLCAFLRGEEIEISPPPQGNGPLVVLLCGAPLGGGRAVGNRLKNAYPKGLRLRQS